MIITRSPLRITLGGGGTDIPIFYKKINASFVSAAISLHVYVSINSINENTYLLRYSTFETCKSIDEIKHPIIREVLKYFKVKPGIEITSFADIKSGTGLGSSGAFTVALIKAVSIHLNKKINNKEIAHLASYIEINVLKESVGLQDTYASALGSVRYFTINKNGKVSHRNLLKNNLKLEKYFNNLYLLNTQQQRDASKELNNTIFAKDSESLVFNNLLKAKEAGNRSKKLLSIDGDLESFGHELTNQWKIKFERSPSSFHKEVDNKIQQLIALGCTGGKLIGAGGGGFILVHCPKKNLINIKKYVQKHKLQILDFEIDTLGLSSFEL